MPVVVLEERRRGGVDGAGALRLLLLPAGRRRRRVGTEERVVGPVIAVPRLPEVGSKKKDCICPATSIF